ncbi:MAG: hydroxymethylglutaryl-CoA lyase [Burkholderiaceae bacterium]
MTQAHLSIGSGSLPARVFITEVGARDGLQNEKQPIPTPTKLELCRRLLDAGVRQLEATSFVSPKWVPQLADAAQLMAGLPRPAGSTISVLTPNMKGFDAALAAGADEVVIFAAASEAFSMRNINCSIADSIERFRPVAEAAHANKLPIRASVSVAFGCPYQGKVPVESVVDVAARLRDLGVHEVSIADTIGVGTARQVVQVFDAVARAVPLEHLSGHFHDTYGQAIANIVAALEAGVFRFDSSIAGLGGCPYAKGATGNVATEDVVFLMQGLGIDTGLDLDQLVDTGQWISAQLGRKGVSRVGNALAAKRQPDTAAA